MKRLKITLTLTEKKPIPFNNAYDLYKFNLNFLDESQIALFHGSNINNFLISSLYVNFKIDKGMMLPMSNSIYYYVSGSSAKILSDFNKNLIDSLKRKFVLFNNIEVTLSKCEIIEYTFDESDVFYCRAGINMSYKTIQDGIEKIEYISPEHPEYNRLIFDNLCNKYKQACIGDEDFTEYRDKFRVVLKSGVKIRNNKLKEWHKKPITSHSFKFVFENCPDILKRVAVACGVGRRNSMSYGFIEKV